MNAISAFQRGVLIGAHGCKCLLRVVNDSVFALRISLWHENHE